MVRRRKYEELNPKNLVGTVKYGGRGVLVWGCMSASGLDTMNETEKRSMGLMQGCSAQGLVKYKVSGLRKHSKMDVGSSQGARLQEEVESSFSTFSFKVFPGRLRTFREEPEERFHEDIKDMERHYQR
ncbi:hypothetical protein AVEN_258749-1 [Araneus ventricosus]|uniref:Uncharacterized protein n=1 Tax=Araneus ventricosus TaxID=182803 RepID=A0A4Y2D3J8_ARAVE|nr:hypothetical protein AVEN_258749-1 [Araneus ventricosus]